MVLGARASKLAGNLSLAWQRRISTLILLTSLGLMIGTAVPLLLEAPRHDAYAYWTAWDGQLYDDRLLSDRWAYLYSPAFAQAIWPLTLLPWPAFYATSLAANIWALSVFVGWRWVGWLLVLFWPASLLLTAGNVEAMMGVALIAGFRWPAAWSFVVLTKVTPGIGLLYFVGARNWRALAGASAATAVVVAVSAALAPDLWREWARVLLASWGQPEQNPLPVYWPLWIRLTAAAAIALLAGIRSWPWAVPVAAFLALPNVWQHSWVLLFAAIPLASASRRSRDFFGRRAEVSVLGRSA